MTEICGAARHNLKRGKRASEKDRKNKTGGRFSATVRAVLIITILCYNNRLPSERDAEFQCAGSPGAPLQPLIRPPEQRTGKTRHHHHHHHLLTQALSSAANLRPTKGIKRKTKCFIPQLHLGICTNEGVSLYLSHSPYECIFLVARSRSRSWLSHKNKKKQTITTHTQKNKTKKPNKQTKNRFRSTSASEMFLSLCIVSCLFPPLILSPLISFGDT